MTAQTGVAQLREKKQLFGLDHLRAFAILYVFLYHYSGIFGHPDWINTAGKFGWTGVDLFFVLSGYLISSHLFADIGQQQKISFKRFFIKRFFRIIPAYLFVLTLYFLFPSIREREGLAPLWRYLSFTQNLGLDLRYHGTFSHAWSLCVEEQFYLALPLILISLIYFKFFTKGRWLLLLLFMFGIIARLYSWYHFVLPAENSGHVAIEWTKFIYYPTYCRLDGLLTGILLAAIFQFRPTLAAFVQKNNASILTAGVIILVIAYFICFDQQSFTASIAGFLLVSTGYGLVTAAAISPANFLYRRRSKITATVAALSYAIYLSHKIIIHVTQEQLSKLGMDENSNWVLLVCCITSFLGAVLLNRLVEKPFLRLKEKLLQKTPVN